MAYYSRVTNKLRPAVDHAVYGLCLSLCLQPESVSIRLPLSAESQRMGLFTSLGVELCNCPVTVEPTAQKGTAGKRKAAETVEATFAVDSVLFAGGPVWALDWCPAPTPGDAAAGPLQTVETLAVATHPRSARRNPINVAQQGPGVVQVRLSGGTGGGGGWGWEAGVCGEGRSAEVSKTTNTSAR